MLLRHIARPLFASWFVSEGYDAARRPDVHAVRARATVERVARLVPRGALGGAVDRYREPTTAQLVTLVRAHGAATAAASRLRALIEHEGLPIAEREPFEGDPESPDHPQLIQLSWRLLPVADLDAERHAGALQAMAEAGEEVDVSAPIDQEGPDLGVLELTGGAEDGVPLSELLIWADGPRSYSDYVFRGACRAARLPWQPEGPGDDELNPGVL